MPAVPFDTLVAELAAAHRLELQRATGELQRENATLRAQLQELRALQEDALPAKPFVAEQPVAGKASTELELVMTTVVSASPAKPCPEVATPPRDSLFEVDDSSHEDVPQARPSFMGVPKTVGGIIRGLKRKSQMAKPFEPRDIVFQELCVQKYPDQQWNDLSARQRVELIRDALQPERCLVSPQSPFMRFWDLSIAVGLAFTAIITPFEVVFLDTDGSRLGLVVLNRMIDVLFFTDMILQFFLKVEVERPHKGGHIVLRDPVLLRWRYLKSWFLLDLVSIIPFDAIDTAIATSSQIMQKAQLMRSLKLLRVVKLARIVRTSRILLRWRNDIPLTFSSQKLLLFVVVLIVLSHWMASLWGYVGLSLSAELCDPSGQRIEWEAGRPPIQEVSWVSTLFFGKTSPDSPCEPFDVYMASLHWAVMTITSIGYGDIVPVRLEEYLVGIVGMLAGGVLWAYVIGSVCSIISNRSPVEVRFESNTDLLNNIMREAKVPPTERRSYREFLREAKSYDRRVCFTQVAHQFSPALRKRLLHHVTKDCIEAVYYFRQAPDEFIMDLASAVSPRFFSRGEHLNSVLNCLCMIDRGTVIQNRVVLVHPGVFHEDFIVTRQEYRKTPVTMSLTYTQILVLTKDELQDLLEQYPTFASTLRKCAAKIALSRAMCIAARRYTKRQKFKGQPSLSTAFSRVFGSVGPSSVAELENNSEMSI